MVMGVARKVQIRTDISIHYDELPSTATLPAHPFPLLAFYIRTTSALIKYRLLSFLTRISLLHYMVYLLVSYLYLTK